jgi:class 3 adenylate cyclase
MKDPALVNNDEFYNFNDAGDLSFQGEKQVRIGAFTLIFSDPEEEKEFREKLHAKSRKVTRISLVVFIFFILSMFVSDRMLVDGDSEDGYTTKQILARDIIRGIQLPIGLVWLYLTYLESFQTFYISFTSFATLAIGFLSVSMSIVGEQPDHGPHMLYLFFAWLFVRLPFIAAVFVCWPIFLAYSVGVPLFVPDYNEKSSSGTFRISVTYLALTNVALNLAAFFIERLDRKEFLHSKSIEREDQVNKDLLLNLLHRSVTLKLEKNVSGHGSAEPIANFEKNVSILFSDLVGFTRYASTITARNLVNFLNDLYHQFDRLCDLVGAYKVETIGDAYFVSAGCPEPNDQHAECLVQLGLMMIAECKQITLENGKHPQVRVGVHSGAVMAGVVGKKMPRYHLFGRTVTIAERMESTGKPGQVQVSEATYDLIRNSYRCKLYQDKSDDLSATYLIVGKIDENGRVIDVKDFSNFLPPTE